MYEWNLSCLSTISLIGLLQLSFVLIVVPYCIWLFRPILGLLLHCRVCLLHFCVDFEEWYTCYIVFFLIYACSWSYRISSTIKLFSNFFTVSCWPLIMLSWRRFCVTHRIWKILGKFICMFPIMHRTYTIIVFIHFFFIAVCIEDWRHLCLCCNY